MSVILNNYFKLGEQFDGDLTTKDLRGAYWISPKGEVFHIAVDGTIEIGRPSSIFKLKPCKELNECVTVSPSSDPTVNCRLTIVNGKVRDHIVYKKGARLCQA